MGFTPFHFTAIDRAAECARAYVASARAAGREVPYGKSQSLVRWIHTGATMAEARAKMAKYDVEVFRALSFISGRWAGERDLVDFSRNGSDEEWIDQLLKNGLFVIGTVDEVRRQLIEQWEQLPAEYCCFIMHYALQPKEVCIEEMETFTRHIKPDLDRITAKALGV